MTKSNALQFGSGATSVVAGSVTGNFAYRKFGPSGITPNDLIMNEPFEQWSNNADTTSSVYCIDQVSSFGSIGANR